jgi:exodeoxyribonuclease V alpha subunit
LRKALVRLTRNWRSGENPQLAAFLLAVQENDPAVALDLARRGGSVRLHPVPGREALEAFLEERVLPAFRPLLAIDDPTEALRRLNEFRLVCALRQGPWGADALNAAAVARLRACASRPAHGSYFHGMPLIVTRNDPLTGLSNGDSGVVLFEGRRQVAWFGGAEAARPVPVQRLPRHQAACALTVHRSQARSTVASRSSSRRRTTRCSHAKWFTPPPAAHATASSSTARPKS